MKEKLTEIEVLARQGLVHEAMEVAKKAGIDDKKTAEIITKGLVSMQINHSFSSEEKIEQRGIN